MFNSTSLRIMGVCGVVALFALGVYWLVAATETTTPPPENLTAFERGEYYFNPSASGNYDLAKARANYLQALQEDPQGNPLVWYQLGRVDFIENKLDDAIYKFNKQIAYFGDAVPNVHYMLGLAYGYKAQETGDTADWQAAEAGFAEYIAHDPTAPWPRVDLAWLYFSQGKYTEMLPLLEEGLRYEPDHAWLLNTYGLALLNTGERAQAREQFARAQTAAAQLTMADWGAAYTGNSPDTWPAGLAEFRMVIAQNLELASQP